MEAGRSRTRSALRFLTHDLRLAWRDVRAGFGGLSPRALGGLILLVVGVMHAALWTIADDIGALAADPATRGSAEGLALPLTGFILLLMLAQTLNGATKLLYARGDLDLILSSPVSARLVLGVRALAVALGAFASAAIFVLPLANDAALDGHARLLALYPTLAAGALLAAAMGIAITLALFKMLGPRRTRLAAQVLATFVGAGFVIALQLRRMLPGLLPHDLLPRDLLDPGGWPYAMLTLPARAAFGDPGAVALWLALSLGAFALAALGLGPLFAGSANAAVGMTPASAAIPSGGRPSRHRRRAFPAGPLTGLRLKEWRLITRDPWIVSQILLQILYMTPMIALLWSGSGDPALAVSPMIVVVTFQVASSLTWLGLSGEDAPDLLASAPVAASVLHRGKIEAVGSLTIGIVALPLLYLAWAAPRPALITLALGAVGLGVAVALQSWHGRPGRRSAFAARHRESKLMALIEMSLSMLLGITAAVGVLESPWALAPLSVVGLLVLWLRPSRRGGA